MFQLFSPRIGVWWLVCLHQQTGGSLRAERHLADLSLLGPTEGSGHSGTSGWMETAPVNE